jgi:hypothetical protein
MYQRYPDEFFPKQQEETLLCTCNRSFSQIDCHAYDYRPFRVTVRMILLLRNAIRPRERITRTYIDYPALSRASQAHTGHTSSLQTLTAPSIFLWSI